MIPVLNNILGRELLINYLNLQIILGMFCLVFLTGFFSGLYPAFYISSIVPTAILKNITGGLGSRNSLRKTLVVFQFSLSIVIIVSTLVISKQMNFIQNKNLGFEKENLLYAWVPGKNNEVLKAELLKNPNILSVGASGAQLDWLGWWSGINKWEGKKHEENISFGVLEVDYDYLKTYKMEMAEGRYYFRRFSSDQDNSIIVNQAAIKVMNLENPIGKTINYNGKDRTIIGVVKNFNYGSLREEIGPMLFVLYPRQLRCLGIKISGNDVVSTVNYINNVFKTNILDDKIEVKFLDDQLNQLYKDEIRRGILFFYFSFISIFIALLGLFGMAAYGIERRRKEIGIRKVLGATVFKITLVLIKEYLYWILIANLIAAPVAYYFMRNWLEGFAYRINIDITEFLIAGGSVLMVALLTVGIKAIKATFSNPVESLRYE
jgi:ABC-type antimicrobial peptide transport system permease subunit